VPDETGRWIVSFVPERLTSVIHHLTDFGVHRAGFSTLDEVGDRSEARQVPALVLPEIGTITIDPGTVDTPDLRQIPPTRGILRIRSEYYFRRAPVSFSLAPLPTLLDWLDESNQTWVRNALAMEVDDDYGAGIVAGVVDSGVSAHPDLAGRLRPGVSLVPGEPSTADLLGHGTHCAGLIVGARAPQQGVRYGIAPAAEVTPIRVFGTDEKAPETTVRAGLLEGARTCRVLSLAAGRLAPGGFFPEDEQLARYLVTKGVLLFAAAGNDSNRAMSLVEPTRAPGNAPFVPAIGAMTAGKAVWNSSNGLGDDPADRVDAVTPGVNVRSAWLAGGMRTLAGTSASTAIAAGVAVAMWSRDPSLPAAQVLRNLWRAAAAMPNAAVGSAGVGYLRVSA